VEPLRKALALSSDLEDNVLIKFGWVHDTAAHDGGTFSGPLSIQQRQGLIRSLTDFAVNTAAEIHYRVTPLEELPQRPEQREDDPDRYSNPPLLLLLLLRLSS
jgi:hypothetical protein